MSKAIIVDPEDYDQAQAIEQAKQLVLEFCDANKISRPKFCDRGFGTGPGRFGYYRRDTIHYNSKRTRRPTKTPGFSWSFTGYKADLTAPGVIAHELGHHLDWHRHVEHEDWARIVRHEPQIGSYGATCVAEDIAESTRIFVLNPDLLRQGRPSRYAYFTEVAGLEPVVEELWHDVLLFAHDRMLAAAHRWIASGILAMDKAS